MLLAQVTQSLNPTIALEHELQKERREGKDDADDAESLIQVLYYFLPLISAIDSL
jgi:hypothetical protein